jgi:hypothetical protein
MDDFGDVFRKWICFWHKLQKFGLLANRCGYLEKLKGICRMGMTHNKMECCRCLAELEFEAPPPIVEFLSVSVQLNLRWITKSTHQT